MYEILFQDSYAEWVVPLTLALIWLLSLQLFFTAHPVHAHRKMDSDWKSAIFIVPTIINERPIAIGPQLIKSVKRKECPDDPEGPHLSI